MLALNWPSHPFQLTKNERLLYLVYRAQYADQTTKRERQGRSRGHKVRVAKGVSFRVGQSDGHIVESDVITEYGSGTLGVSTKYLFFSGDRKTLRIRLDRIVSVRSQLETIEVVRDRASGQPEYFTVDAAETSFLAQLIRAVPAADFGRKAPEEMPFSQP